MTPRHLAALALAVAVATSCVSAQTPPTLQPLSDFGAKCTSSSSCQSGVCGYSCSARDFNPLATTSCVCPCNTADGDGPCCCGCLAAARYAPGGTAAVTTCPAGDARAEGPTAGAAKRTLAAGDATFLYARLVEAGALEDEAVQWGDAAGATKKTKYDGAVNPGGKPFGELCASNAECALGICGTGCDCDSSLEKTCSCNAQSHFPVSTCGGCVRGRNPAVRACPKGVGIESTGTMVWVPASPTARVSPAYCTMLQLASRGAYGSAVSAYPAACASGANAAVGSAFNGTNFNDAASVSALYDSLLKLLCNWTPPGGSARLSECKGHSTAPKPAAAVAGGAAAAAKPFGHKAGKPKL